MKKLAKVLLGATLLSALFVGCNNGLVANDVADAPELKGFATDNGVIVLKWADVKDASQYKLYVKDPDTEEFASKGVVTSPYTYNVYKTEKDYEFKLVVESNKLNLLANESSITVTTPEAWKPYTFSGSDIKISQTANTVNNYDVFFPVDAGYDYSIKFVNIKSDAASAYALYSFNLNDEAVSFVNNYAWGGAMSYNGATYNKEVDPEDEEKTVAPWVAQAMISANATSNKAEEYVCVVKATPKNSAVAGKAIYTVSTATAKGLAADDVALRNASVARTTASGARVSFEPVAKKGSYPAADKFTVYRTEQVDETKNGVTVTTYSALTKLGTPVAKTKLNSATAPIYIYDDTLAAYDSTGAKTYTYRYYILAEGNENNVWTAVRGTVSPSGNTAAIAYSTSDIDYVTGNSTSSSTVNVGISYTNETVVFQYATFASIDAAKKAVAEEVTTAMPAATSTTKTDITWTNIYTIDGVQTSLSYTGGNTTERFTGVPMDAGVTVTRTTDSAAKKYTQSTDNNGKYYVLRLVGTKTNGEKDVSVAAGYITKTVTTVGSSTTTTYDYTPISLN